MKKMYQVPQTETLKVKADAAILSTSPGGEGTFAPTVPGMPNPGTIAPAPAKASADSVQVY